MAELAGTSLFNDANLVAYYKLEDVNDSKGSRNLTNNGTTTFSAAKYGNGADGGASNTTKYLSTTVDNYGIDNGACTIAGWVNITTAPSGAEYGLIALTSSVNHIMYLLGYNDSGGTKSMIAHRTRQGTADDTTSYNVDFGTGALHHVALTYDTTTLKLYVDGALGNSVAASGNGSSGLTSGFGILTSNTAGLTKTSGIVDDVPVFSRALTLSEIQTLYNPATQTGGAFLQFFT